LAELTLESLAERIEAIEKMLDARESVSSDRRSAGTSDDDPEFVRPVIVQGPAAGGAERGYVTP
jgi:hypothetical protein